MRIRGIWRFVLGVVILTASSGLWSSENYEVVNGPKRYYFGHISFVEPTPEGTDPVVLREGRSEPEQAALNLPLGPGDTVRTSSGRRLEIQFDTGTVIRLDFSTEVRLETILAKSLSSQEELSNLALERGRIYVMYKEYDRHEMFQVLTAHAAIKMKHNSVVMVAAAEDGATETQVKFGKAQMLFGESEKLLEDHVVKKGERLIVQKDSQFQIAPAIADTAFDLWNEDINARFEDLHEGLSALPKPIQRLPRAVFHFAQTYGSRYGEWLWDDFYGYVWRPFLNDGKYPWGWQPYYYGRWSYAGGQMFWVPEEPWGWIPYHLGIWQWDKKHGWIWLPGSMFAPAWATWDFFFGYACWRPFSLFDWLGGYGSPWVSGFSFVSGNWIYSPKSIVRKDQLKQSSATPYPIPAELRNVVKRVTAAWIKGDVRMRDSAAEVSRQLIFVTKDDLKARAINEKALTWDQVSKSSLSLSGEAAALRRFTDPRREAARIFRGLDGQAAVPRKVSPPAPKADEGRSMIAVPAASPGRFGIAVQRREASTVRFRDWNPDLRVARELGVHIVYSSARNEIRCPELRFSSQDRERATGFRPHLTSRGISYGPAVSVGGGPSGGPSSSSSATSSGQSSTRGQTERSSSSSGDRDSKRNDSEKIIK